MVYKVSDLLSLAEELTRDKMQYVSLTEYKNPDGTYISVFATSSVDSPEAIDYEEIESVPGMDF